MRSWSSTTPGNRPVRTTHHLVHCFGQSAVAGFPSICRSIHVTTDPNTGATPPTAQPFARHSSAPSVRGLGRVRRRWGGVAGARMTPLRLSLQEAPPQVDGLLIRVMAPA